MKITRQSPTRRRQPLRPLSRLTSPDPFVAQMVSLASIRLRMSADNFTHCRVAAEVKAIYFMLNYRI